MTDDRGSGILWICGGSFGVGVLWGQVVELPGCFATGEDLDELAEALGEAITLYEAKRESAPPKPKGPAPRRRYRVDKMTLVDA
jgi:predicted RNase H-like HicB family nuclease